MKVLSLNCQKAYQPTLKAFLHNTLEAAIYDFILLQEANAPVLALMPSLGAYGMLNLFNQETKEQSHLCILYRSSFELTDSALHSFAFMHPDPHLQFAGFGLLLGTFRMNGQMVQIGSVHLHPGLRPQVRIQEARLLKQHLLAERREDAPLIFGGDFNFGFPGEVGQGFRLLAPDFVPATRSLGPTLDSRYSEYHPNIINGTAVFLAKFGLAIRLRTDHFFVDADTARKQGIRVRKLPDRVSDHSPIELTWPV